MVTDAKISNICPKCGKQLSGIRLLYKIKWLCSECVEDRQDVLHCERGCKVIASNLDNGYPCDSEQAHELLSIGQVYEVERLEVGSCNSKIWLKEFPGISFNTVHFTRKE